MKEKRKERKDVKEMPKLSQTRFAIFEGCVKSKNMQIPRSHTYTHIHTQTAVFGRAELIRPKGGSRI